MRSVVLDAVSGRQVIAGREERDATQPLISYLQKLGWSGEQIVTRPQWRVPKSPSAARASGYPIDIAIFDSAASRLDPDHIRILVECKAPDEETGIGQLKTYLNLEPEARLGIWFNGQAHCLVRKTSKGFVVDRDAPIPKPNDSLAESWVAPPLRYDDLVPPPNLGEIFRKLRDRIAAQDTHVNRDEFILNDLASLLICKISDEQAGELAPEKPLAFQTLGSATATARAIRNLFEKVKGQLGSVFTDDSDRIHVDDRSLEAVVRALQSYRLLGNDRHAVGTAFQILRGRALKGEEGAYFTPLAVVDCVVSILRPDSDSRIVDPACGTGGFLAASLDYVFASIDAKRGVREEAKADAKRRWAQDNLFAIDKDIVSTKLCKAYLALLGDGRSHVYRADAIDRSGWTKREDDLRRAASDETFDMCLTNPPFGQKLKVSPDVARSEGFVTCRRWKEEAPDWVATDVVSEQQVGLAFFERCLRLLKPGGQIAIVLPETFVFSKSFRWFVDWVCASCTVTHVVDVPMVAFEEYCRAKTCLLFVRKRPPTRGHRITMSFPKSIGQDRRGNALYKLDSTGERTGKLDNEMAEAVDRILAAEYSGVPRTSTKSSGSVDRLCFYVEQAAARRRGVLVPRFWWRDDSEVGLSNWAAEHSAELVSLGELVDQGLLTTFEGHGSPPGNARATGDVPYVKVTDLKNWRISENPTNFIHQKVADKLRRRGPNLHYADLVTPARASSNIGQFSLVLPWQTHVVLTKEVLVLRVLPNDLELSPFLLLALLSLAVVQEQYRTLVLMQTNREHLGDHWREVRIPLPTTIERRRQIAKPVAEYFQSIVTARQSWGELTSLIPSRDFATRP